MRLINEIVVHCTATPEGRDFSVAQIDAMHRHRGFDGIGYHYLIGLDGTVRQGRAVERVGAHVAGRNANTIGVSYVGGIDRAGRAKDTRTSAQREALRRLLGDITARFSTIKRISGHREYANKACPCFDARVEYADLVPAGMPAKAAPERYRAQGAVTLLSEPMGEVAAEMPKNAPIVTTGQRSGDWVEVTHGETIGWVHDQQINQREVAKPAAKSRTLWANFMSGGGVVGTACTTVAQALGAIQEYAPWIIGITVALTIAGVALSTLAKLQDDGKGAAE